MAGKRLCVSTTYRERFISPHSSEHTSFSIALPSDLEGYTRGQAAPRVCEMRVIIQVLQERAASLPEAFNPGLPVLLPRASGLHTAAPALGMSSRLSFGWFILSYL